MDRLIPFMGPVLQLGLSVVLEIIKVNKYYVDAFDARY